MNSKVELKLDWCSHAAAKYAVDKWHYSRTMPSGKLVKIGVWESSKFVGTIIFGLGATPQLSKRYDLLMTECCELVRIALTTHKTYVSRIVSVAIRMLKLKCPKCRLVVSFADTRQGHHGGIYQAANWIYSGKARLDTWVINGIRMHPRSVVAKFGTQAVSHIIKIDANAFKTWDDKHRYIMPLDTAMRAQIEPLRQPYPKRVGSVESDTPAPPGGKGRCESDLDAPHTSHQG